MAEKNIDAEIKRKLKEFDDDIAAYLKRLQSGNNSTSNANPAVERLRQAVMTRRQKTGKSE